MTVINLNNRVLLLLKFDNDGHVIENCKEFFNRPIFVYVVTPKNNEYIRITNEISPLSLTLT